jgi:hypothetical protein
MTIQQYPTPESGIPTGVTADRPAAPNTGDVFYNGTTGNLEIYTGTQWIPSSAPPSKPTISVTDASTGDAYSSTGGKLNVSITEGTLGGKGITYSAATTSGGFVASSSSTSVTITGLTPGTSYQVTGAVENGLGISPNSDASNAIVPSTKPQSPTIGTASTSGATSDVTVTWTLNSNGGKNLSSITITPFLNGTTAQTSQTAATTSSTTHTFTGLTGGNAYTFKVKTTNANGDSPDSTATNSVTIPNLIAVDYLVIAGGGGGGKGSTGTTADGAGGGAGGYRTSAGTSGGGASAETTKYLLFSTNYTVTVGGGGAGSSSTNTNGTKGSNSVFDNITSTGGGGGVSNNAAPDAGVSGGSGGGGHVYSGAGNGTANQGFGGATATADNSAGGGGGAGSAGTAGTFGQGGAGGSGVSSDITGSSVSRGGGGGGGGTTGGTATAGGGNGGSNASGSAGSANTGGGAGGSAEGGASGGSAGSGVVILRYSDARTITIGAGLTGTESAASGGYKRATITAGTGNVSWA